MRPRRRRGLVRGLARRHAHDSRQRRGGGDLARGYSTQSARRANERRAREATRRRRPTKARVVRHRVRDHARGNGEPELERAVLGAGDAGVVGTRRGENGRAAASRRGNGRGRKTPTRRMAEVFRFAVERDWSITRSVGGVYYVSPPRLRARIALKPAAAPPRARSRITLGPENPTSLRASENCKLNSFFLISSPIAGNASRHHG